MNLDALRGVVPMVVINQIPQVANTYAINSALRLGHFLAQCAHESGDFAKATENLYYSERTLLRVFPKYFNEESAKEYAMNPIKIANKVYANRYGNGNEDSADGYKYRGRGFIQLTFHDNYAAFDKTVPEDILANPDLVATKYPLLSAAWFWNNKHLNLIADKGATVQVVTQVTKVINGGDIGLDARISKFNKLYRLLTS